jgi:hypothetical protein
MIKVRKIVAPTCICDPNHSGMDKNAASSLISNISPRIYTPMNNEIWDWKVLILLDLIDNSTKKVKDTKKRIDVITDIYGVNSGFKSRFKLDTSLFLFSLHLFY